MVQVFVLNGDGAQIFNDLSAGKLRYLLPGEHLQNLGGGDHDLDFSVFPLQCGGWQQ